MRLAFRLRSGIVVFYLLGAAVTYAQQAPSVAPSNTTTPQEQPAQPVAPAPQAAPVDPGAAAAGAISGGAPIISSAPANYRIAPNDTVEVRVFREPDLNTTARVANDGTIMMPLAGQIKIGGLTVEQAAGTIKARLSGGYLTDPQVYVGVSQYNRRFFTVLGQVTRSGTYEFPEQQTLDLLQAIGLAGGYTKIADPARVVIRRTIGGKSKIYRVNAKRLASGRSAELIEVLPGDVITVSESIF
jgi:protein involved in polysaccharide export with SLBB domain